MIINVEHVALAGGSRRDKGRRQEATIFRFEYWKFALAARRKVGPPYFGSFSCIAICCGRGQDE
jgi:hypothetical protein